MSSIYIQEPPTHGKVLLETTVGDIDIELWSREAPKACRNFIQLCMEGYYNGTIFHRLVKGFIVQGGDPTGTGRGGNSIWGAPFKDEFHSRLRFMRRGLVAMANAGKDDNGSQFFFTLGQTPELQNKHTIFGKVTGNTIYNMLKLEEGEVDHDEKPIYAHKITGAKILFNPFDDIVPRETIKKVKDKDKKKKDTGTKNYKLLSFGEEAEEEEEEVAAVNQKFSGKSKSSHDLTKDPKLSSKVAVDPSTLTKPLKRRHDRESSDDDEDDDEDDEEEEDKTHQLSRVQEKLKSKSKTSDASTKKTSDSSSKKSKRAEKDSDVEEDEGEEEGAYYLGKDADMAKKKRLDDLKKEYKDLRTSMKKSAEDSKKETEAKKKEIELTTDNNLIQEFVQTQKSYKEKTATNKKKGSDREEQTMALLKRFQKKLEHVKETEPEAPSSSSKPVADEDDPEDNSDTWLAKSLDYEGDELTLAKDANLKTNDWYALDDPRNPVVQRRREEAKRAAKKSMSMGSRRDLI